VSEREKVKEKGEIYTLFDRRSCLWYLLVFH